MNKINDQLLNHTHTHSYTQHKSLKRKKKQNILNHEQPTLGTKCEIEVGFKYYPI